MNPNRGTVGLEQFAVAGTEKENFWSAQATLAPFLPKAMLWTIDGRSMASPAESGSTAPALQGRVLHPRLQSVLVTTLATICCLVLWGFAAPALAKTIVVTTLTDTADPPFNADSLCGSGTVDDLPGADGLISLREAIIAANNTNGEQTITFDPSLSGNTLVVNFDDLDADATPDPLPALCGGHTRIKGDLDSDDVPDITLEGSAFPAASGVAGLTVLASDVTIKGLQVQHFPIGILMQAGDATTPATVKHTTVTNNILAESTLDGLIVRTGNAPGSFLGDTSITHNVVMQNARFGIRVAVNLSGAGSDTHIAHTTIADNEVVENGNSGILMLPLGDHNLITDLTIARNTASGNAAQGINVFGGVVGADENTLDVYIRDNTVTDNRLNGIRVVGSQDNSSNNHVVARIHGNTLERNQPIGIIIHGGQGAVSFPTGTSVNNVVDVRIERNTLKNQGSVGIFVDGGIGSTDGRAGAIADNNQVTAIVRQNVIEGSPVVGVQLAAGGTGLASANTLDVWVMKNTVCNNGTDILGEGGLSGNIIFPVPNQGTGNVLEGQIFQNTATTVVVADGTPGNTATVTQFNNDPCP